MQVKRHRRKPLGAVTAHFVEAAQQIPEVRLVVLSQVAGEEPRLWTVIDAPPSEPGCRRRVYEAEGDAIASGPETIGFRLINLQELRHPLEQVLPPGAQVLLDRRSAA